MGVSVLLRLLLSSNEVCNTSALQRIHEQHYIFNDTTVGPMIPKEMKKYNLRYETSIPSGPQF